MLRGAGRPSIDWDPERLGWRRERERGLARGRMKKETWRKRESEKAGGSQRILPSSLLKTNDDVCRTFTIT